VSYSLLFTIESPAEVADAYNALADYTVLPLENTIFGPVTETLDCFFTSLDPATQTVDFESVSGPSRSLEANGSDRKGKGKQKMIIASLDLPIQHCLVVRKGTRLEDIHWVRSHEQASLSTPVLNSHPRMEIGGTDTAGTRSIIYLLENASAGGETDTDRFDCVGGSITVAEQHGRGAGSCNM
jgi:prephenate dehydratase